MIPLKENRELVSSGTQECAHFEISAKDAGHIMLILRDTLYSDKIMAVLREYSSNAWDANREAGRGDVPIRVTLPMLADPTLRIRDVGFGLSPDQIKRVYTQYGASTKREDNESVGMLGIGSKSGFAYSDSFTVTSWNGGKKRIYVAVIDNSDKGRMDLMHEEDCGDETGVEISVPVRPKDILAFSERAEKLFVHFLPPPDINIAIPIENRGEEIEGFGRIWKPNEWSDRSKFVAIMGCVPYRVDLNQLVDPNGRNNLGEHVKYLSGILRFQVGDLQVAASREELKYGESTVAALISKIVEVIDEYVRRLLNGIDKLDPWHRRLRIIEIANMRLPIPQQYSKLSGSYANLAPKHGAPPLRFKVQKIHESYRRRRSNRVSLRDSNEVTVSLNARIVIRDDKRQIGGYPIGGNDSIIVPNAGTIIQMVKKELNDFLISSELNGIPVINMSSLPWTAPSVDRQPTKRDNERAKARCFILDVTNVGPNQQLYFDETKLSKSWLPVERTPKDNDVYVVLESYRVANMDSFYNEIRLDRKRLINAGLNLPEIVGYKSTVARPVDAAKLKGCDYKTWRKTGMVDLLLKSAGAKTACEEEAWLRVIPEVISRMEPEVLKTLGESHALTKFVRKAIAKRISAKATAQTVMRDITNTIFNHRPNFCEEEPKKELAAITDVYPMLKLINVDMTATSKCDIIVSYVRMIDEYQKLNKQKDEEAAA